MLYVPKVKSKDDAGTWGIREPGDFWEAQNRPSSEFELLAKKSNFLSERFGRIVLLCTAESLPHVILLPAILALTIHLLI